MDDLPFYIIFNSIQLYQDDGRRIMVGYTQQNAVYIWKDSHHKRGSNPVPPDLYDRTSIILELIKK